MRISLHQKREADDVAWCLDDCSRAMQRAASMRNRRWSHWTAEREPAPAEQRYADFEGAEPVLTPRDAPIGFDENTNPMAREFAEFYSTPRGYHSNSITQFTTTSSVRRRSTRHERSLSTDDTKTRGRKLQLPPRPEATV